MCSFLKTLTEKPMQLHALEKQIVVEKEVVFGFCASVFFV